MLIDWFTVFAQIVNFLVLVWLLRKFLYRRILGAVEAREGRIAARLAEAQAKENEAAARMALYEAKLQDLERQQAALLREAKLEASKQRGEMLARASAEVRALETRWTEELEREQSAFLLDLRRRAAAEILAVTRRAVADLACLDVQECAIRVFLDKVRSLDEEARRNLARGELLIRAAFDVPEETRARIREVLEDRLETPVALRFERSPGTGLGVELRGNGWRIGWNSESYLEALEQDLREALEHSPEPKVPAEVA